MRNRVQNRSPLRLLLAAVTVLASFLFAARFTGDTVVQTALAKDQGRGSPPPQANQGAGRSGANSPPAGANSASSATSAKALGDERPGWGCGDANHVHTGPPGNPDPGESGCTKSVWRAGGNQYGDWDSAYRYANVHRYANSDGTHEHRYDGSNRNTDSKRDGAYQHGN
jgi:hypothetical protein